MNNLDFVPQKLARRADAQTTKASGGLPDGQDAGTPGNGNEFSTLLKDMGVKEASAGRGGSGSGEVSRMPQGSGVTLPPVSDLVEVLDDLTGADEPTSSDRTVEDLLQAVNADGAGGTGTAQAASGAFSFLEGLLPRIPGQAGLGRAGEAGDPGSGGTEGNNPSIAADQAEGLLNSPSAPTVRVSVTGQETHFKPVVEGFTTKVVTPDQSLDEGDTTSADELMAAAGQKTPAKKPSADSSVPPGGLAQANASVKASPEKPEELVAFKGPGAERTHAKANLGVSGIEAGAKTDQPEALPAGTLNRIAHAVVAEAKQMAADTNTAASHTAAAQFLTSAKASESAVRTLNLQLHPADLGLITIRMKLTGDNLEMELQVSNDETARLLKTDTDKLTSLLKGSGYRPDVITIQTAASDATGQDGAGFSRQQQPSSSQQDAFQRGTQQRQHNGSQHPDSGHQNERKGGRDDVSGEDSSSGRSTGGIYL